LIKDLAGLVFRSLIEDLAGLVFRRWEKERETIDQR